VIGPGFADTLAAAQTGAPWALRALYDDLAPAVTGYLRLRGATEPDDITSEAFLDVFRGLASFDGDESGFRSWVFTIAHRRLIDERRRRGRRVSTEPLETAAEPVGGDVEDEALDGLVATWVRDALDVLTDEQRSVILLRVVADLSAEQVAQVLGKRPDAIRATQHRALRRLRRVLESQRVTGLNGSDEHG
jgi:RNA polymerase sigma factor (sigma-70 family)